MDWDRYKRECDSPGVFSRWMLMQTLELLQAPGAAQADSQAEVRAALSSSLAGAALAKPVDHSGGASTDMFRLALTVEQAHAVLGVVQQAVATGATTSGTHGRGLGGFVEAWSDYAASLGKAR